MRKMDAKKQSVAITSENKRLLLEEKARREYMTETALINEAIRKVFGYENECVKGKR
jgi:hypothetical protein